MGCGIIGRPKVFSRVDKFLPWIEKVMKIEIASRTNKTRAVGIFFFVLMYVLY